MPIHFRPAVAVRVLFIGLGFVSAAFASPGHASGAPYTIDWYLMGSGGTSATTSGDLLLRGSIAQPVSGPSSGGGYTLDAGFWYGIDADCADCIFTDDFELKD